MQILGLFTPIIWHTRPIRVPEPSSLGLLGFGLLFILILFFGARKIKNG